MRSKKKSFSNQSKYKKSILKNKLFKDTKAQNNQKKTNNLSLRKNDKPNQNFGIFFNKPYSNISYRVPENFKTWFDKLNNNLKLKSLMKKKKKKNINEKFKLIGKRSFFLGSKNQQDKIYSLLKSQSKRIKKKSLFQHTYSDSDKIYNSNEFFDYTQNCKPNMKLKKLHKPILSLRNISEHSTNQTKFTFLDSSKQSNDMLKTFKKIKALDSKGFTDSKFREIICKMCEDFVFNESEERPVKSTEKYNNHSINSINLLQNKNNSN